MKRILKRVVKASLEDYYSVDFSLSSLIFIHSHQLFISPAPLCFIPWIIFISVCAWRANYMMMPSFSVFENTLSSPALWTKKIKSSAQHLQRSNPFVYVLISSDTFFFTYLLSLSWFYLAMQLSVNILCIWIRQKCTSVMDIFRGTIYVHMTRVCYRSLLLGPVWNKRENIGI